MLFVIGGVLLLNSLPWQAESNGARPGTQSARVGKRNMTQKTMVLLGVFFFTCSDNILYRSYLCTMSSSMGTGTLQDTSPSTILASAGAGQQCQLP